MVDAVWLTAERDGRIVGCELMLGDSDTWFVTGLGTDYDVKYVYFALGYADIRCAIERGARALLDTSAEPLRQGCAAGPTLVKPNAVEAEEMTGREIHSDADVLSAAAFFLEQGVRLAALSLGAEGLLLASRQQAVWARPPWLLIRNPVGAGDASLAGMAWALERGLALEEIARWGVATGTAAAMREGVSVGTRDEVKRLYERIRTEVVEKSGCR